MKPKKRRYYILHINCNCASYTEARTNLPKGMWGSARCSHCKKMVGLFQWKFTAIVMALGNSDALRIYDEMRKLRKSLISNLESIG